MEDWLGMASSTRIKERRGIMNHKGIRITLLVIELFVGLWAVIGGVGLVTGSIAFLQMPVTYLQRTPFNDYTIPGLVLLLVVGGSNLFAATTILTRRTIGILASALAGLILIGFEVVEVAIIDRDPATLPTVRNLATSCLTHTCWIPCTKTLAGP